MSVRGGLCNVDYIAAEVVCRLIPFAVVQPEPIMPPFRGDAFWSVGMFDAEYLFAPAEHDGWVVRHRCDGLNLFGSGEEPKRTGPG